MPSTKKETRSFFRRSSSSRNSVMTYRASLVAILSVSTSLLAGASAAAQQSGSDGSIDDLKAPPSPAFVLLDIAPSKVERPQAVRPLVISALTAVGNEGF